MKTDKYSDLRPLDRDTDNRFSFWWDKVKDCGIPVPKTVVVKAPIEVAAASLDGDIEKAEKWFKADVFPKLKQEQLHGPFFVKNAVFSNKFNAKTCMCDCESDMVSAFVQINGEAACLIMGYDGLDEFVIRERIRHNMRVTPCIYNGLPLRTEIRVFYDFDTHEVIFSHNYWDYDYVAPNLYRATDRIVFEHQRETIEAQFAELQPVAERLVAEHMRNVKDMHGPWSIDLMADEKGKLWLIDMATAEMSAYWDRRPGVQSAEEEGT